MSIKVQTGLRLDEQLLRKVTWIAKDQKRSLNAQLEFVVQEFVKDFERQHGEIRTDQ